MIETNMKPGEISSERLWDIIKRCELSEEEELELFKYCQSKNIIYLSTPSQEKQQTDLIRWVSRHLKSIRNVIIIL